MRLAGNVPDPLLMRLAAGKLQSSGPDAWKIDGTLTLSVKSGGTARLRGTGAKQELLVPIGSGATATTLEVDYVW